MPTKTKKDYENSINYKFDIYRNICKQHFAGLIPPEVVEEAVLLHFDLVMDAFIYQALVKNSYPVQFKPYIEP